jgi:hypothetical protein
MVPENTCVILRRSSCEMDKNAEPVWDPCASLLVQKRLVVKHCSGAVGCHKSPGSLPDSQQGRSQVRDVHENKPSGGCTTVSAYEYFTVYRQNVRLT